jgi:hypothetical protein
MKSRSRRTGRTLFLAYLGAVGVLVLAAAPLVSALEPVAKERQAAARGSASAGSSSVAPGPAALSAERQPAFEDCDRNGDGFVDKSEAASVPGLSANFERADLNQDARLDPDEFNKALASLRTRWK